ncbi:O-antigen ligase family protein [Lactobacillus sp. PSON]|uniref:O-antigen ligase family protein n=1 Tax=Lactobacillus sp. PSON TaxID=3455454 RepID=UPI0040414547
MDFQKNSINYILTVVLSIACFILMLFGITTNDLFSYIIVFGILLLLGWMFNMGYMYIKINNTQKIWGLFLVYTVIITLFSSLIMNNIKSNINLIILNLLFYIILLYFSQFCDKRLFLVILKNFFAVCVILAIFEYITKIQLYRSFITDSAALKTFQSFGTVGTSQYRLMLFFSHPIYFALFLNIFLMMLLLIPYKSRMLNVMMYILALFCLILTQSRSGWIAYVVILLIYLLKMGKIKKINLKFWGYIFLLILFCIVSYRIIAIIAPNIFDNINNIFSQRLSIVINSPEIASGARMANLSLINYVNNDWLKIFGGGNGYALYLLTAHPTVNGWTNAVDNQYLTFILNYGLIGIAIFLFFIYKVLIDLKHSKNNLNILLALSIITFCIMGYFFEFYIQIYVNYILFIFIAFLNKDC